MSPKGPPLPLRERYKSRKSLNYLFPMFTQAVAKDTVSLQEASTIIVVEIVFTATGRLDISWLSGTVR